jgi:hypothetical protein
VQGSLYLGKLGGPGQLNAVAARQLIHIFQQAFPLVHWGFLQHPAKLLFSTCLGPEAVWPGWVSLFLAGEIAW